MIVFPLSRELTRELLLLSRHLVRWGRVIILSRGHGVAADPTWRWSFASLLATVSPLDVGTQKEIKQTFTYGAQNDILGIHHLSYTLSCFRPSQYVRR